MFRGLSKRSKSALISGIIIFVAVTFTVSLLYTGFHFGRGQQAEGEGGVIATVDGQKISRANFETLYRNTLLAQRDRGATVSLDMYGPMRAAVLDQMITRVLLTGAAGKEKVQVPSKEIKAKLDEQKKQFSSEKEFRDALSKAGITVGDLTKAIREQLTVQTLIDKVKGKAVVTDEEVARAYKEKNKKEPAGPEFEAAKETIRKGLLEEAQNRALDEWFKGVRDNADIKINDDQINAIMSLQKGDTDKAIEIFSKAIKGDPENAELYLGRGAAYLKKNDIKTAVQDYEQAVKYAPEDAYAHFYLGDLYRRAGRADDAAKELKKASDLAYTDILLHFRLQGVYTAMGRSQDVKYEQGKIQEIQKVLERMNSSGGK